VPNPLLVLLHSPLVGAAAWGRVPALLRAAGRDVLVTEVVDDDQPPFAVRYVARAAGQVGAGSAPAVLVGLAEAGPLLPPLGGALHARDRPVGGYVLVDADLPRRGGGASRLDLLAADDPARARDLEALLEGGGRFPAWAPHDLVADVPDPDDRAALAASQRPRDRSFFAEPVPQPADWPDAPCGYLHTSPAMDRQARLAAARGWSVRALPAGRFAMLRDPDGAAVALTALLADL
jgi:hypothetical protein